MELECPRCHKNTPVPARLCQHCGFPLTSRAASAASGKTQPTNWAPTTVSPQAQPSPVANAGTMHASLFQFGYQTVVSAVAGLVGSTVASLILWVTLPWRDLSAVNSLQIVLTLGIVAGFCIPAAIAAAPDTIQRQFHRALRFGVRGGIIGVTITTLIGLLITQFATPHDVFVGFYGSAIRGALAWTLFGCGLGLADGVSRGSRQRMLLGALGGAIGGLFAFILTVVVRNEGTFVGVGLFVGLCSGLVQDALKQAWVRIISGANEGTELILDKPRVRFGSSDASDVDLGLYQDPAVAPRHFEIVYQNGDFFLKTLPNTPLLQINGSIISAASHRLHDGDQIRIGHTVLTFHARTRKV